MSRRYCIFSQEIGASAPTIQAAIDAVYAALAPISWENMQYRRDIAKKALKHLQS